MPDLLAASGEPGCAHDRGQVVDCSCQVLIHNNIIEFAAVAHLLARGDQPLLEPDRDKPTVIALREVAAGKVGIEMLHKMAPTVTL